MFRGNIEFPQANDHVFCFICPFAFYSILGGFDLSNVNGSKLKALVSREPDILFPVVRSEIEAVHMQLVECGERIMEAEAHLKWINEEYLKEDEVHKTLLQKFRKKRDKLQAFYERNGVFLDSFPLGLPFK